MKRRGLAVPILVLTLSASGAWAVPFVDAIIDGLRAQGYDAIDVSRTLLGRTRIEATGDNLRREIILDPRTGEILRDYWEMTTETSGQLGATGPVQPVSGSGTSVSGGTSVSSGTSGSSGSGSSGSSGSGSNSGSGSSGSGDDDDDRDDDRDDDSDDD